MLFPADLAGDFTVGVSSPANLVGGVIVGVAPSADFSEAASSADLAGVVTVGVMSLAIAEVASLADIAGDVTVGVSSPAVAEVASLANLAGDFTVGATSLADSVGVVTAGMAYQERCDVLSGSVYDYDYCCDNELGYFDYDDPHHSDDDPDYFVYG